VVLALRAADGTENVLTTTRAVGKQSAWFEWTADLSTQAGAQGTLVLRVEPGQTEVGDVVLIASPAVVGTPASEVRRVIVIGIDTLKPTRVSFKVNDKGRKVRVAKGSGVEIDV
jgi:hypothetical protein